MGTKIRKTAPNHLVPPGDMEEFMVITIRPSAKELDGFNKAEKYDLLKANSIKRKKEIKAWVKNKGLDAEVFKIGKPTVFSILFINCTPKVAEQLEHCNAVVSVSRSSDISVKNIALFSTV